MAEYLVSADAGNSGIKVLVNEVHKSIYPNIYGERSQVRYEDGQSFQEPKYIKNKGRALLDVSVVMGMNTENPKGKSRSFLFGDVTNKFPEYITNRPNVDKYNDEQLAANTITAVAHAILSTMIEEKEELHSTIKVSMDLSVGLPYKEWQDREKKKTFATMFKGKHVVSFNCPFFEEQLGVEKIELTVENVLVECEGSAALDVMYGLKEEEYINKMEMLDKMWVLLDIGAFTTDVIAAQFTIANDDDDFDMYDEEQEVEIQLEKSPSYSFGVSKGIGSAMEDIIREVHEQYPDENITRKHIESSMGRLGIKNGTRGWIPGTEINVKDKCDKHFNLLGKSLGETLDNQYGKVKSRIDKFFVVGGGTRVTKAVQKLEEVLKEKGFNSEIVIVEDPDPVFANVIGYYMKLVAVLNALGK